MMLASGTLAELDVASIAATTSLGRSSLRLEVRAASGEPIGSLVLKAGRIVSATAGAVHGRDALRVIMSAGGDARFQLAREPLDFALSSALASVDELGKLAHGSTGTARVSVYGGGEDTRSDLPSARRRTASPAVVEGSLSEFDIPTILHTLGSSRQYYALEVHGEHATAGTIFLKAGIVQSATAGSFTGLRAIQHLIASHARDRFRLVQLAGEVPEQVPLGPVTHVLLSIDAPAPPPPVTRSPTSPVAPPRAPTHAPEDRVAPPAAASAAPAAAPELVLMEGKLSDFDVRTVLEVLAATRQHARLQIFDAGQPPLGEIALKAGQIISGQAGNLQGRNALVFLLGASRQLWFRVVTGSPDLASQEPLGSIHELLAGIEIGAVRRREPTTSALRWAIPLSFLVGGAIVFVVVRGGGGPSAEPHAAPPGRLAPAIEPAGQAPRDHAPPIANTAPPASAGAASQAGSAVQLTEVPTPPARQAAPPPEPQPLPPPAPARRSAGMSIQNAQTALKRLGYDPGPLDNAYGPQTRNAIMQFQRSQRLPATGFLDRDTWSAIVGQLMP